MGGASKTAEAAALGTRPNAKIIAVATSPDHKHAVVLVDKGRPGDPYVLQVVCERADDGWHSHSDSSGNGWTALRGEDAEGRPVGVMTFWGEAPPDAELVAIRWRGDTTEARVASGHYLFIAWDVPDERSDDLPELATPQ